MIQGLAAAGATIVLNGRNERKLANVVKSFEAEGRRTHARAFDVADEASVLAAFEHFDAAGVAIDILVNNAGVQHVAPLPEFPPAEFARIQALMVTAPFLLIRRSTDRQLALHRCWSPAP